MIVPPADPNVDVRLHVDRPRGRLFVDLVNRGWDAASDTLPAAGPQQVTIVLPEWLRDAPLVFRTAAGRGTVTGTLADGGQAVVLTAGDLQDILTVIVELP